jgi:hypothetical protein
MRSSQPEPRAELRVQAKRAVDAAAELGDPELETLMLREAAILERPHDPDRARAYLERALAIAECRADLRGQAQILRNLARPGISSGAQRLEYIKRAVAVARQAGEASVLAYALLDLSTLVEDSTDLAAAAADEAWELAGKTGMDDVRDTAAAQRAWIAMETGDNETAIRMAQWVLDHGAPADEINTFYARLVQVQAYYRSGAAAVGRAEALRLHDLVVGREAIFAEATGHDWYADAKATVNALLASDATAHDGQ